jgi:hypothetical protein
VRGVHVRNDVAHKRQSTRGGLRAHRRHVHGQRVGTVADDRGDNMSSSSSASAGSAREDAGMWVRLRRREEADEDAGTPCKPDAIVSLGLPFEEVRPEAQGGRVKRSSEPVRPTARA